MTDEASVAALVRAPRGAGAGVTAGRALVALVALVALLSACAPAAGPVSRSGPNEPRCPAVVPPAAGVTLPMAQGNDAGAKVTTEAEDAELYAMPASVTERGKKRHPTAVVFFAPAKPPLDTDEAGLSAVAPNPLQPAVCTDRGKLKFGAACGVLLPARTTVRLSGGQQVEVRRGGGLPSGETKLKPPLAPACCMYAGCHGVTHPFSAAEGAWVINKPVIAIWPADADVDLETPALERELPEDVLTNATRAVLALSGNVTAAVHQAFEVRGHRYLTTRSLGQWGAMFLREDAGTWRAQMVPTVQHSRAVMVLAVTDVDHDGKNEVLTLAPYANDYAFAVLVDDQTVPGWSYSCGNI